MQTQTFSTAIDALEHEKAQLEARIKTIDDCLALLNGESVRAERHARTVVHPWNAETKGQKARPKHVTAMLANPNKKPMSTFAYEVLKQNRKPMHLTQIAEAIIKRGYKTTSNFETFVSSVGSKMRKEKERFRRLNEGIYTVVSEAGTNATEPSAG